MRETTKMGWKGILKVRIEVQFLRSTYFSKAAF
jgi:hypothetical protein